MRVFAEPPQPPNKQRDGFMGQIRKSGVYALRKQLSKLLLVHRQKAFIEDLFDKPECRFLA